MSAVQEAVQGNMFNIHRPGYDESYHTEYTNPRTNQIHVCSVIKKQTEKSLAVKVNIELFGLYALQQQESLEVKSFQTKYTIVSVETNCEEFYDGSVDVLDRKECEFQEKDSGIVGDSTNVTRNVVPQNHAADATRSDTLRVLQTLKERATNTENMTQHIVATLLERVHDNILCSLPRNNTMKRMVPRIRNKNNIPHIPMDVQQINMCTLPFL
ncbi:hypothetical protein FQA39_LY00674 [Lamprigera yunnana]|nr:hypothetical protein FQA39_LY00674 [Lamprigera yunnana]